MSVYAMILTGLMIGSGPEMVSGELARYPFGGIWEGSLQCEGLADLRMDLVDGRLSIYLGGQSQVISRPAIDEGEGRLRITLDEGEFLGIYQEKGDRLVICLRSPGEGWPSSFRAVKDRQGLLILRCAKPRK